MAGLSPPYGTGATLRSVSNIIGLAISHFEASTGKIATMRTRHSIIQGIAILIVSLGVCSSAHAKEPKLKTYNSYGGMFSREKPKSGEPVGCVGGSLGRWRSRGNHVLISLEFQRASEIGTNNMIASANWTESLWGQNAEIKEDGSARDIFRLCLRPGDYKLNAFVVSHGYLIQRTTRDLEIPIRIEADKTVYIGSFLLMETGEAHPCSGAQSLMRLIHEDRSEVDLPLLNRFTGGVDAVKEIALTAGNAPFIYPCTTSDPSV